jgi:ribonucleoside-diphosphate reductase alpha chain
VVQEKYVIKRDGSKEKLDLEKFHKVCAWACEGITGVSASVLELKTQLQFHEDITTSYITEATIKAAADLITEDTPNYQFVGSRLINYHLRKVVYGNIEPPSLFEHVKHICDLGYYTRELLEWYDESEFNQMDNFINHDRDYLITFVGMEQFRGKYLVKNRTTGQIFETPQMAYMLIAASLFNQYPKEKRMKWIKNYYDAISTFDISLPTPILAGVRTPQKQFSSCVLVESEDSLDSINSTATSIVKYASQRAGLGIGATRIRAIGSPVRNGDTSHTGVVPFIKYFQAALKSCAQGGIRQSSGTLNLLCWHYEIEDLIVLKNNKGIEENRARHLDYVIQFNRVMYERLLSGGNITLFSPNDVPDLYDAFYRNADDFKTLYEKYEADPKIRKKTIKAVDLFSQFLQERKDTGRIYLMNVDHVNDHSSFKVPVRMTNLCTEVTLPTTPLKDIYDEYGEIALCILSATNWGKIKEPSDFERACTLAVRGLDALIDYQYYPVLAAKRSAANRRPLGIGIINFAYWMAKNDISYQDIDKEGLKKIHEYAEAWSYYLIKASVDLAKEKGACAFNHETKYSDGILPIDTYKKDVDQLVKPKYHMDWKKLREDLKQYGIRNSTLMALMPSESSSQISNATNGIEPPRAYVSIKQSLDGVLKQVVPEYRRLKNKYDLLWDQKSPKGYLKICAVLQKFIDQAISVNTSYNPKFYENEKIPLSVLFNDLLEFYKYGGKNLYYFNTHDGAGEISVAEVKPVEVAENDSEDSSCDSCKI